MFLVQNPSSNCPPVVFEGFIIYFSLYNDASSSKPNAIIFILLLTKRITEIGNGAIRWGTALQAGRSRVRISMES
jgi:hypothetical protein